MATSSKMHIDTCRMYINFMINTGHWSGLDKQRIFSWLENFSDCNEEELVLVYKLLVNIIYFSENEIKNVLTEGINKLYYKNIVTAQLSNDFQLSQKALNNIKNDRLNKTLFVPLLNSDSPHESSNYILRLMVTNHLISSTQSLFPNRLVEKMSNGEYDSIVIVDDCVGSGQQINDFWKDYTLPGGQLLKDFCGENNINATYLTLFGYNKNIETLRKQYTDLNIICVRDLVDNQRAFDENSYIWKDLTECKKAAGLFKEIAENHSIPFLGYCNLDFVFAMHQTIPDWSLPILWKERVDWNPLLRRKNSYV